MVYCWSRSMCRSGGTGQSGSLQSFCIKCSQVNLEVLKQEDQPGVHRRDSSDIDSFLSIHSRAPSIRKGNTWRCRLALVLVEVLVELLAGY